jgi:hypothetical protein
VSRAARRDRDAEARRHPRAAGRLLAGTPLRSTTGKLTGTELITEYGLRRDVVYGDHKDLVEEFQAQVKAQQFTPLAALDLAAERDELASELAGVRRELAREQAAGAALRRIAAELAIELDQARSEMAASENVTPLPRSARKTLALPCGDCGSTAARNWSDRRPRGTGPGTALFAQPVPYDHGLWMLLRRSRNWLRIRCARGPWMRS